MNNTIHIAAKPGRNDVKVYLDGKELTPEHSQKVHNHSPDGFNVGYGGSGPAQLALAILLQCTYKAIAQEFYQEFKWEFVANWEVGFTYYVDIADWLNRKQMAGAGE